MSEILTAMRDTAENHLGAGQRYPAEITTIWANHVERLETTNAALLAALSDIKEMCDPLEIYGEIYGFIEGTLEETNAQSGQHSTGAET